MFEWLDITFNDVCQLNRNASILVAAIDVMQNSNFNIFSTPLRNEKLLPYFNHHLGTNFKTFDTRNVQPETKEAIKLYISRCFIK